MSWAFVPFTARASPSCGHDGGRDFEMLAAGVGIAFARHFFPAKSSATLPGLSGLWPSAARLVLLSPLRRIPDSQRQSGAGDQLRLRELVVAVLFWALASAVRGYRPLNGP